MNSKKNKVDVHDVIQKTEEVLKKIDMKIKGWTVSRENPPEELTDDGVSIGFSGISWFPVIDSFSLNISSLHFGKKKRGKISTDLDVFDPSKH